VIAVGGTNLYRAKNARGWREVAWEETGSWCSEFEPKPAWQTDTGCRKRTENDVSAVAGCNTPVSVYSSLDGGWLDVCGTSASAPLVAGIDAHASEYTRSLGPQAFYEDPQALFDVRSGSDGTCKPAYLCTAGIGYDGPTGLGTPDGVLLVTPP
jgi:subtilase family serine protease